MPRGLRSLRSQAGFTIVEALAAAFVLLVGVLGAVALVDRANQTTAVTADREAANNLVRELIEGARGVPYEDLATTTLNGKLQAIPGLEDQPVGGPYTIVRRNTVFTVSDSVCVMDDARDGAGARPSGVNFCAESTPVTNPATDKNPEDYKRVSVTVSWTIRGYTRTVTNTGVVNNPGSATGPSVRSLAPSGWTSPYEITSDVASLAIKITTSSKATTVPWTVDGTAQTPTATADDGTGMAWTANWSIHPAGGTALDDGPYLIEAQAFNSSGVSGSDRSETITLNRFTPRAPTHVAGGRTGSGVVEIEWDANTERDIIGYDVRRSDGTVVCPLSTQKLSTVCDDMNPPNGQHVFYIVRAYDTAPGSSTARAGADSATLDVVQGNNPPSAPTNLNLSSSGGTTTLTWQRPAAPVDPDAGDDILFYRIYRDGTAITDRYDRWYSSANSMTWQDIRTGGTQHTYWVDAVDTHYGESTMLGPVTG